MSKKLIVAMALSLVLVSGSLFSAQADCGLNLCGLQWSSFFSCGANNMADRDADRANDISRNGVYVPSPWPPGQ